MQRLILIAACLCLNFGSRPGVAAIMCPFCDAPSLLRAEQIQQCDHVLLARWKGGEKPTEKSAGTAEFEILQVSKSRGDIFAAGSSIMMPQYIAGAEGGTYMLLGPGERLQDWHVPEEVDQVTWEYMASIPDPVRDPAKRVERLAYFIDFLEHPSLAVSNDAFSEFAAAPYEEIRELRSRLPREKIREWLMDPGTSVTRMGLYGLLLGLCGNEDDAALMEHKIMTLDNNFRLGIEGVMSGYILIRGEQGLQVLEDARMKSTTWKAADGKEQVIPFAEVYATMQALRFLWKYEPGRIPQERLKQSMRILLVRPELTDLVVVDLSRWKDWDVMDQLMEMYDQEKFSTPAIRRSIVRFLLTCADDKPRDAPADAELPAHVVRAEAALKHIEEVDPKTLTDAKRYLIR